MRFAIDASRTTVARVTGTEHYALELIHGLIRHNPGHQLTLYFRDQPTTDLFPEDPHIIQKVVTFPRTWTHLRFAAALWADRPDVTFVPAHTLPLLFPGRGVVTVHDLGYRHFPDAHPRRSRLYLDLTTAYSSRRAKIVLADSQATADDLTRFYNITPGKIRVVYPGVDAPTVNPVDVRREYGLPERYLLFIGTLQPRKNIARLVQAYARYRETVDHPAGLALAGGQGWLYDPAWTRGVDGVIETGYIDENHKGALLAGALALVFPSLYEGFGFPVIEAMHCDTPVITSTTSSLPELAGDAALLVDPLNTDAITTAMTRLDRDGDLRQSLRQRGKMQVNKFTWDGAAQQTLAALETAGAR